MGTIAVSGRVELSGVSPGRRKLWDRMVEFVNTVGDAMRSESRLSGLDFTTVIDIAGPYEPMLNILFSANYNCECSKDVAETKSLRLESMLSEYLELIKSGFSRRWGAPGDVFTQIDTDYTEFEPEQDADCSAAVERRAGFDS